MPEPPDDRSREFRDMLEKIAQKHKHCRDIIEQYPGRPAERSSR